MLPVLLLLATIALADADSGSAAPGHSRPFTLPDAPETFTQEQLDKYADDANLTQNFVYLDNAVQSLASAVSGGATTAGSAAVAPTVQEQIEEAVQETVRPVIQELQDEIQLVAETEVEMAAKEDLHEEAMETEDLDMRGSLLEISNWYFNETTEEQKVQIKATIAALGYTEGLKAIALSQGFTPESSNFQAMAHLGQYLEVEENRNEFFRHFKQGSRLSQMEVSTESRIFQRAEDRAIDHIEEETGTGGEEAPEEAPQEAESGWWCLWC